MDSNETKVAVIGIAGRFPGARDVDEYWQNLCSGVESIRFFTAEELAGGEDQTLLADPNYVPARGYLADMDAFDAEFFGIIPRLAQAMNPQHRLFLEATWHAFEDAGYIPGTYEGVVGVYAGCSTNDYAAMAVADAALRAAIGDSQIVSHNEKDFLPLLASYRLNLRGPSVNVQSACSTSLVAIHQACQSLIAGESDLCVAGGVSVRGLTKKGYLYQESGINSPDGHCRAFDAEARGTVGGDGVGVVLLKRLDDALRDRDRIRAVVHGSAVNNDGSDKLGYTAPSAAGQAAVVAEALAAAGVDPADVGYVEAHGTGTELGDPIELAGLREGFAAVASTRNRTSRCSIGSVKTNIGHLDAAAGVAGFIKAVLCLEHRTIPASLHFRKPNPKLDIENSPFQVADRTVPWDGTTPRFAGVSSLGVGGTNAHLVLSEAPAPGVDCDEEPDLDQPANARPEIWPVSGRTKQAADQLLQNLARHLRDHPELRGTDVAFTLQEGRHPQPERRAVVCADRDDGIRAIETADPSRLVTGSVSEAARRVVFLFPGQVSQYAGMAAGLYRRRPEFREQVDLCAGLFESHIGVDLRTELFESAEPGEQANARLARTDLAQCALFTVEYALAKLWMSWGVLPAAMVGHSIGEYVAACLSGVLSLPDATAVVARRGELMEPACRGGRMLAVWQGEDEIRSRLPEALSVAAVNGPELCVVSGLAADVSRYDEELRGLGVTTRLLPTEYAFHSALTTSMLQPFTDAMSAIRLGRPAIPYTSNLSGTWIGEPELADPGYWARHARETVRFTDCVRTAAAGRAVWLEVGPGNTLSSLVAGIEEDASAVPSLPRSAPPGEDDLQLTVAAARLWALGVECDWKRLRPSGRGRRVALPAYPFERRHHWAGPDDRNEGEADMANGSVGVSDAARVRLIERVRDLLASLYGRPTSELPVDQSFLALGAESLFLLQVTHALRREFAVAVPLRELLESHNTVEKLADYLLERLPPEPQPTAPPVTQATPPIAPAAGPPPAVPVTRAPMAARSAASDAPMPLPDGIDPVARLIAQQLEVMQRQLEILEAQPAYAPAEGGVVSHAEETAPFRGQREGAPHQVTPPNVLDDGGPLHGQPESAPHQVTPRNAPDGGGPAPYVAYKPVDRSSLALTEAQRTHVDDLVARVTKKTAGSKQQAARERGWHADARSTAGFRLELKEARYPLTVARAAGSHIEDVDGHDYVDIAMGYGCLLFGHAPAFVTEAIRHELDRGMPVGPRSAVAGEAAELLCEVTGAERAAFMNSGTEAVMAALRMAKAVTDRPLVVQLSGSYHGSFDGTLVVPDPTGDRDGAAMPMCPGVSPEYAKSSLIFPYGAQSTVDNIEQIAGQVAAVIVEPMQSRRPAQQVSDFLRRLREVTAKHGIALIFDEVVSGFRVHPRGMQGLLGIEADLTTYGKTLGGGMPIGAVAGRRLYLDTVDGGDWQFGDASMPMSVQTFATGTFWKHAAVMASVRAVLRELTSKGAELQRELSARTTAMVEQANAELQKAGRPVRMSHFGSLFRVDLPPMLAHPDLFWLHMLERGVYTWEGRVCYLSTAHTDQDTARVRDAVVDTVAELDEHGFFDVRGTTGRSSPAGGNVARRAENATELVPLTPIQSWFFGQGFENPNHWNQAVTLLAARALAPELVEAAARGLMGRHDALRLRIVSTAVGRRQRFPDPGEADVPYHFLDLSGMPKAEREPAIQREKDHWHTSLDIERGPLVRFVHFRLGPDEPDQLLVIAHHLVIDIVSWQLVIDDLERILQSGLDGKEAHLPEPTTSYRQWSRTLSRIAQERRVREQAEWWLPPRDLRLAALPRKPVNGKEPGNSDAVAITAELDTEHTERLCRELPRTFGTNPDEVLLAALARALCAWSDAGAVRVDLEHHGRVPVDPTVDVSRTVGWFTTLVPLYLPAGPESKPDQTIEQVRERVRGLPLEGLGYGLLAYGEASDPAVSALGPAEVVFSYIGSAHGKTGDSDRLLRRSPEPSGQAQATENARPYVLDVSCRLVGDRVRLVWVYRQDQFGADQIQHGLSLFVAELERLLEMAGTG